MKKLTLLICVLISAIYSFAQCPNGDAEMNNFTNWQGYTGLFTSGTLGGTLNLNTFTPGLVPGRHSIVAAGGVDPIVGSAIPLVPEGNYAFKLGNNNVLAEAEILSYTFTVPSNFSFRYAMVLQDPTSHSLVQKPFFSYWISTSSNLATSALPGNLITTPKKFVADFTNPYYKNTFYNGELVVYKEWQNECVPSLANYVGQTVTIYFATADCSEGSHFGYAYIDGLCKPNLPTVVLNGPTISTCNMNDNLIYDGEGTTNGTEFMWSVKECNAYGSPIGTSSFSTSPVYGPVQPYNLKSYADRQAGHYYLVTLSVRNCSGQWVSASKIVYINYPPIMTTNKVICCGNSVQLMAYISNFLGAGVVSNYKWYDEKGTFLGNGGMSYIINPTFSGPGGPLQIMANLLTVTPSQSTKYRVVFDNGTCKNEQWVYVTMMKYAIPGGFSCISYTGNGNISFDPGVSLCGDANLISDYNFHLQAAKKAYTYQWNTGATTDNINMTTGNTYSVTVTSPCGSNTYSMTTRALTGAFPNLFISSGMKVSDPFIVYNTLTSIGAAPAYNATYYELRIWDRWGGSASGGLSSIVYYKNGTSCTGFKNGEITWNGKTNEGVDVNRPAVYFYELKLYNGNNSKTYTGNVTFVQ